MLTHCAPQKVQERLVRTLHHGDYPRNSLTDFLQDVSEKIQFGAWFFGHYHTNKSMKKYTVLYENILRIE